MWLVGLMWLVGFNIQVLYQGAHPACSSVIKPMMTTLYTALDKGCKRRRLIANTEQSTSIVPSMKVCRTA